MKTRLLAVADIFGQDIPDVRSFRFPGEYFRVEMVRVGMGRQNIQPSGAFQKVPVYIKLRGIPIIIDQNGKFFAFNNKATVVDINKSHRFHVANIYLFG